VQLTVNHGSWVKGLLEREENTSCLIGKTHKMIDCHRKLLEAIQGMKFDLGVDKYMRSTPEKLWLELERQQRKDEESQRQLFIAYTEAEKVFQRLEKRREIGGRNTRAVEVPSENLSSGDSTN
jgi:hypothetical protein